MSEREAKRNGEANQRSETAKRSEASMTTGEAARALSAKLDATFGSREVRRLCERGALRFAWTRSEDERTHDLYGRELRGHRRVTADSVEAFVRAELAKRKAK